MKRSTFALILIAITTLAVPARSEETHRPEEVRIAMSDGVELAADLYRPAGDGPFPVILIRTPYDKKGIRVFGEAFVEAGYAVLIQDVRGKWRSQGEFVPFLNEERDGLETLDWIAAAAWSNGRVGVWGSSYLGMAGLLLARHGHPALETVFSAAGWIEGSSINAPGGALHIMLAIPWLLFEEGQTQRSLRDFDLEELFHYLPLIGVFDSVGLEIPAWKDLRVLHANGEEKPAASDTPVFHVAGWYDFVTPGSLAAWRAMRKSSDAPQRLLVGPWLHDQIYTDLTEVGEIEVGENAVLGIEGLSALAIEWFDCRLRDRCSAEPPVRVYVLGENRWRDFDDWPP
ncbi:MAG TPA: CocE/NonD family hydrolase, partial [Thermoanaerobaculia bacterium]